VDETTRDSKPGGLTNEQVRHIAVLARLGLTEDEIEVLRVQLSTILAHVDQLTELDTEAIPPTAQVIALHDVTAPDVPTPSFDPEEMLANAPDREGSYFKVRSILGYET